MSSKQTYRLFDKHEKNEELSVVLIIVKFKFKL